MSVTYLIAFSGRPRASFLTALREIAGEAGTEITGAILTSGPGCYNLALRVEAENEPFINQLTMTLMPARWSTTTEIEAGRFVDEIHSG